MRIALTLDRDADPEANDYVRSLVAAGVPRSSIEIVTPLSPRKGSFDALLLGGGVDVDPARYGTEARPDANVEVDAERDAIDFSLLREALRARRPVLGICRGLQVINVALGGTLVQDLELERPSAVVHQYEGKEKTRLDHRVKISPGTRLASIAGFASEVAVNSRHHQAIAQLAPGLSVCATAEDGVPEAVEASREGWLVAVQWHPENLSTDPVSRSLFAEFVRAARQGSDSGRD